MARSGLGRSTALGTATLLIGANLPDIDVLAYLDGPAADLSFRRGWTHGVLALVVLPFVLTAAVLLLDRLVRRAARAVLPSGVKPGQVLLLAALSVLSHPILDMLNAYGVRWLMPFRGEWYYGDTLFIVDPWLWLVLGVGVVASRRPRAPRGHDPGATRPARIALAASACYVIGMAVSGIVARGIARRELTALGGPVERLMVAPRPLTPFVRQVVAVQGESYRVGIFRWLESAREQPLGRRFLGWARFPTVQTDTSATGQVLVHLIDLRYADRAGAGFGSVTVPLPADRISSMSSYTGSAPLPRTPR